MEQMNFSIHINAPRQKVWDILWEDASYRRWTSAFCEGSHVITDWKEGSKTLFLDGKGNGMVSEIAANRPCDFMSFRHLGEIKNGVEDISSEAVKQWSGAQENYTLEEKDGQTELKIAMDISAVPADFKEYFRKTWPIALRKVKDLAEKN